MVDPSSIASTLGNPLQSFGSQITTYLGYVVLIVVIGGGLWFLYYALQFKYKAEIFIKRGENIGKSKNTRIKAVMEHGVRKWKFFLKKKSMPPLPDEYIFPGNKVKLYKVDEDTYIPIKFKLTQSVVELETIPQDMKFWMINEYQQAAREYQDLKSKYAPMFITIGTVLLCVILTGVTVYFILKFAAGQTGQVVSAIQGLKGIGGFTP